MAKEYGNRKKQEELIINKIQNIFDNAKHIQQFQIEIKGGVEMCTAVTYTVVERLFEDD